MKNIINVIKSKIWVSVIILGLFIAPIEVFAVVQSLNGQSGHAQTFSNDINLTITSSNDIHSLGWNGILSLSRGGVGTNSLTSGSILFSNGTSITQNNSNLFWDNINKRLGIGTSQPTYELDVAGNVSVVKLLSSADSDLHTLTVGLGGGSATTNTAVGFETLKNNTTGSNNTGVGYQALTNSAASTENTAFGFRALANSTTGSNQNTAVGSLALLQNTSGSYNSAFGSGALINNTTGGGNIAIGVGSLEDNNGNGNTSIGYFSLLENTSGDLNVAIGTEAGRLQANGSQLTTPQNGVYLGARVRGYDNSDANSIVIGFEAIGAGTNKAVIGNSSVSDVYFGSSAGLANIHAANIPTVSSGSSTPFSVPSAVGQLYIDTVAAKIYVSTGTVSSADWIIVN
ncbi:MAG TPA: hypothetical protein VJH71_00955 [Candidatus Paceibacterota bacterium]